ncbi:hypothetical protein JHN55_06905 [Streptomyces sp. MBT56]|nr:hypothetical protein [Streptomyces sp. MBT56]MBK3601266.1 hypothetical protein [Streptomyces sp. MBT54]MBK3619290.1 hypothetical protein [Streptomyces sp. MBT98]MBK6046895.1 hypothetical protein [Streptomyces sp. MBT55]
MNKAVAAARDLSALLDEEWPTGTYGDQLPAPCPHPNPNAAAHRQALAEALAGWTCGTTTELRDRAESPQPATEKGKL